MKHKLLFVCVVLQSFTGVAMAEPSTRIAWTPETLRFVSNGNAEKGKVLAESCQSCHSADGRNAVSEYPYLNGQLATYLYRQLHDYKDGGRPNGVMSGIAAGLSDQDMADLAQWYSGQPPRAPQTGQRIGAGTPSLVASGDSKRLIAPCGICHGWDGQGEPVDTPRLAGQKAAYLKQTLLAYQSGERHNDIYRRMRAMSERLSAEEIGALAEYYSRMK